MNREQKARELRRAIQLLVQHNTEVFGIDAAMMEVASLYPAWEADTQYKKDQILRFGENALGDPQLYRVLKTHKATATPDSDGETYQAIGMGNTGYPLWTKPLSNKDAYHKGDVVDREGTLYQSNKNNNQDDPLDETGTWDLYSEEAEA